MPPPARYMVLLALAGTALAQKDVTALFNIDFSTDREGGCQSIGQDRLNEIVRDCRTLAVTGLQLMNDAQPTVINLEAKRLVDAFFQGNTLADRLQIANSYRAVQSFLDNAPLIRGRRPWLFCNDEHVEPHKLSDQAQDNRGDYMDNLDGSQVRISDLPNVVQSIQAAEQATNDKQAPYLDTRLWQYVVDDLLPWPQRLCDNPINQGFTTDSGTSNIILCTQSFQRGSQNLREAEIIPNTLADIKSGNAHGNPPDDLQDALPTAVTLFHELFHLVLGNRDTPDKAYNVFEILTLQVAQGKKNPETLATVAVAYDFTQNSQSDEQGNLVEFFTGFATQG